MFVFDLPRRMWRLLLKLRLLLMLMFVAAADVQQQASTRVPCEFEISCGAQVNSGCSSTLSVPLQLSELSKQLCCLEPSAARCIRLQDAWQGSDVM